jgi:hypothetical protein
MISNILQRVRTMNGKLDLVRTGNDRQVKIDKVRLGLVSLW